MLLDLINDLIAAAKNDDEEESTGRLVASCVWEGGDSINRIEVEAGTVKWVDIEL